MRIRIKSGDKENGYKTHILVDGVDLGLLASSYQLKQEAGELPVLCVEIPVTHLDIDLPESCVLVKLEEKKNETECGSSTGGNRAVYCEI